MNDNLWITTDADPVEDLKAWAKMIAEKVPKNLPHKHGPFFATQVERARAESSTLLCPGCGAQVKP